MRIIIEIAVLAMVFVLIGIVFYKLENHKHENVVEKLETSDVSKSKHARERELAEEMFKRVADRETKNRGYFYEEKRSDRNYTINWKPRKIECEILDEVDGNVKVEYQDRTGGFTTSDGITHYIGQSYIEWKKKAKVFRYYTLDELSEITNETNNVYIDFTKRNKKKNK